MTAPASSNNSSAGGAANLGSAVGKITLDVSGVRRAMQEAQQAVSVGFAGMTASATQGLQQTAAVLQNGWGFMDGVAATARGQSVQVGQAIGDGIRQGVISATGGIIAAVRAMVNSAIQAANSSLGIASPSRVFVEMGGQVVAGLAQGVSQPDGLIRAMDGLTGAMVGNFAGQAATPSVSGGNTYHLNVNVPADLLQNGAGVRQNAEAFGEAVLSALRAR